MINLEIFKGKKAFISGATGGIGKAVAVTLAQCGCDLFLTATDQNELEKLSTELSISNVKIYYSSGNLINKPDVYNIINETKNFRYAYI